MKFITLALFLGVATAKDIEEKILCLDEELNALCNNMEGVYDQLVDRLDLLKREEGLK